MPAHLTQFRVRFGELDPYRHVNHAVYVAYFEAGRTEALESIGLGLDVLADLGWQVVVVDLQMKFRAPARAGDTVTIETTIAELGAVTSRWNQRILRGDQVLVEGSVRAGATDLNGRPKRMPSEIIDRLQQLA